MRIHIYIITLLILSLSSEVYASSRKPTINARSYTLMDFASKKIIFSSNPNQLIEPASMTKVMTAYVVFDEIHNGRISLTDTTKISAQSYSAKGSRTFLEIGSTVDIETLLLGMIVQSGNDASIALAEFISGSELAFSDRMNEVALSIGMENSNFINSTGWPDPDHVTTTKDLAELAYRIIQDFPDLYWMFSERSMTYNNIKQNNRNALLWRDPSVDGLKTGHTSSAGYCLLSSAIRKDRRLISVIAGADSINDRNIESQKMLNYGYRFFVTEKVLPAEVVQKDIRILGGESDYLKLGVLKDVNLTFPKKRENKVITSFSVPEEITAPIKRGDSIGVVTVKIDGEVLYEGALFALNTIPEGGMFKKLKDHSMFWVRSLLNDIKN